MFLPAGTPNDVDLFIRRFSPQKKASGRTSSRYAPHWLVLLSAAEQEADNLTHPIMDWDSRLREFPPTGSARPL
jgi:hypothetical protein